VTVFSVWNAMVGSALVSLPWAFTNSGIVLGIRKDSIKIDVFSGGFLQLLGKLLYLLPCDVNWKKWWWFCRYSVQILWQERMDCYHDFFHSLYLSRSYRIFWTHVISSISLFGCNYWMDLGIYLPRWYSSPLWDFFIDLHLSLTLRAIIHHGQQERFVNLH
jgi:hypothetical protein